MAAAGLAGLGPGEAAAAAQALSLPAESFGNDPRVELAWAMKAHQHAQVYFNLISSVEPKFLKLTQVDERIYEEFRRTFRNLRVDVLDPEELKSEAAKEKWCPFCLSFEGVVEDFSYGAKTWREVAPVLPQLRGRGGGFQLRDSAAPGLARGILGGKFHPGHQDPVPGH
uniref:protein PBDC1 isoform X2 n=1 Tax=Agelaius phoeniceus TaxID=39638 RepID=UPI0023EB9D84|nr:protein PBDC1 isoform X2 [Agelaius phoeniceus]